MKRALHVLVCCLLSLAACKRDAAPARAPHPAAGAATGASTVLAVIPDDAAPPSIALPARGPHPVEPTGELEVFFAERGGGVAFITEKSGKLRVVHNGRPGKSYDVVGDLALSPDGRRCAYAALDGGKWRAVVDGVEGPAFSTVKLPTFSPDGAHVMYQAMSGERWHLVVDGKTNAGTPTHYARTFGFSADSSRIAFVEDVGDDDAGTLVVVELSSGARTIVDRAATAVVWNAAGSRLAAVSASGGRRRVVVVDLARPERAARGAPADAIEGLVFGPDDRSVAYVAERAGTRFVALDGNEVPLPFELAGPLVVRPDGRAVGVMVVLDGAATFRQLFEDGAHEGRYDEAEGLTYRADGGAHAYAARRGETWFVVENGREGPPFDRVVTPQFAPDGRIVYRARKDGKRFVVAVDPRAGTVQQYPPYEQVFPVRFTGGGGSLGYGVKDGNRLAWKVEAP